jgi:hypothetical protein
LSGNRIELGFDCGLIFQARGTATHFAASAAVISPQPLRSASRPSGLEAPDSDLLASTVRHFIDKVRSRSYRFGGCQSVVTESKWD